MPRTPISINLGKLSLETGYSVSYLSRVFRVSPWNQSEVRTPHLIRVAPKIAKALGLTIDQLVDELIFRRAYDPLAKEIAT